MNSFLITICARGGSKGIPGKNIKKLNGTPLIAYTIHSAKKFANKYNGTIGLSTDSPEIVRIASEYGIKTNYLRPAYLATDNAGKMDVIIDLLKYEEEKNQVNFDYLMDLDVTSPLRTLTDLEAAYEMLNSSEQAMNIFSVSPAHRNPYFNMVEEKEDGFVKLVKDQGTILSRQTAPKVYDMNASFYIYKRRFFELGKKTPFTEKTMAYVMPHACFDLDEPIDFQFMEFLLQNNLLGFEI
jgi:CMP-N-acetylneuraminic acid synthetase